MQHLRRASLRQRCAIREAPGPAHQRGAANTRLMQCTIGPVQVSPPSLRRNFQAPNLVVVSAVLCPSPLRGVAQWSAAASEVEKTATSGRGAREAGSGLQRALACRTAPYREGG